MVAPKRLLCAGLALAALLAPPPLAAEVNLRGALDLGELAECVEDSGAIFYGAHWCPYCRKQMAAFGEHAGGLPYVECYDGSRSDGINRSCEQAGVRSFPTWVWPDGRVSTGLKSPQALALATGCTQN